MGMVLNFVLNYGVCVELLIVMKQIVVEVLEKIYMVDEIIEEMIVDYLMIGFLFMEFCDLELLI